MSHPKQPLSSAASEIRLDVRGAGEWIVTAPAAEHALHVYRLSPGDWLVSEVGRDSEGRGADLGEALAALSAGAPAPEWWELVIDALNGAGKHRR